MKNLTLIVLLVGFGWTASAQEAEPVTEEKSSAWLRVTAPRPAAPATTRRPATATTTRKPATPSRSPAAAPVKKDEFNETNKQVNRFRKKGS